MDTDANSLSSPNNGPGQFTLTCRIELVDGDEGRRLAPVQAAALVELLLWAEQNLRSARLDIADGGGVHGRARAGDRAATTVPISDGTSK